MMRRPHETLQMGQLVLYCGPTHPDGKMSQKCQGKPSWLHSRYSSVIHHWTGPKKRPDSPLLKSRHRLHIGFVTISQTPVQYFICLFFKWRRWRVGLYIYWTFTGKMKLYDPNIYLLTVTEACFLQSVRCFKLSMTFIGLPGIQPIWQNLSSTPSLWPSTSIQPSLLPWSDGSLRLTQSIKLHFQKGDK